jgi:hypothetical protein
VLTGKEGALLRSTLLTPLSLLGLTNESPTVAFFSSKGYASGVLPLDMVKLLGFPNI